MATKKPPVTGYRQASDKGRPTKSTPQKRPTSAMPGPRPKTSTRTSNTSTPSPRIKVPAEFNARTIYFGANKPRPGAPTTAEGRIAARGPLNAPGAPALPNARSPRAAVKEMRASIADVRPANKPAAKPTSPARDLSSKTLPVGKPGGAVQSKGGSLVKTGSNGTFSGSQQPSLPAGQTRALPPATSPKPGFASNLRRGAGVLSNAAMFYGIGSAIRQNSPLDSKNDSAARRADPRYQPMRQMSAAEMRNAPKLTQYNPDAPVRKTAAASKPASSSAPARSSSAPTVRNPTPQRTPAMVPQSKNMDENYTTWAKANKDLAEKVKPGQVGYDTIQKALGKTSSDTPAAKPTPKNGSSSGTEQAIRSIESDPKAKPFNTDKVPTKSETDKLKDLQALRIAKRKAGVA